MANALILLGSILERNKPECHMFPNLKILKVVNLDRWRDLVNLSSLILRRNKYTLSGWINK